MRCVWAGTVRQFERSKELPPHRKLWTVKPQGATHVVIFADTSRAPKDQCGVAMLQRDAWRNTRTWTGTAWDSALALYVARRAVVAPDA